jgi:sulfur carrier protein ThiS adenylyltransferase
MKVGIAGVGGIGSNVAVHLVRGGVKQLKIADFDHVDASNLNRQFYFHDQIGRLKVDCLAENLRRIVPDVMIETLALRLDSRNMAAAWADCDPVAEGFDGRDAKKLLMETLAPAGKTIVSASGVSGACLATLSARRLAKCRIIGDFVTDPCRDGVSGPKVAAVAAWMAHIILQAISKNHASGPEGFVEMVCEERRSI